MSLRIIHPTGSVGRTFVAQGGYNEGGNLVKCLLVRGKKPYIVSGTKLNTTGNHWATLFDRVPIGDWTIVAFDTRLGHTLESFQSESITVSTGGEVVTSYPESGMPVDTTFSAWGFTDNAPMDYGKMIDANDNEYDGTLTSAPPPSGGIWVYEFTITGDCANSFTLKVKDSDSVPDETDDIEVFGCD